MADQTPETQSVAETQSETAATPQRARTSDEKFFEVCEAVANDSSIKSGHIKVVSERLGITPGSVTQRRNAFNRQYRESGLTLTEFPRGGGQRKDVNAIAAKLLAMRAEAEQKASETDEVAESTAE